MRIRANSALTIILLGAFLAAPAFAQKRDTGWEFGADISYLLGDQVDFDGGSSINVSDDFGIAISFGYRVNSRFEIQSTLDWSSVDYNANLISSTVPGVELGVSGDMEAFTLMAKAVFNFIDGPITPFISAGAGWSWIDTNIPNGQVQIGCWWDPWYGQICTPYQSTKSVDGFRYSGGLGMRWDINDGISMRASYEMNFLDLDFADGTPSFDQFRIGVVWRY